MTDTMHCQVISTFLVVASMLTSIRAASLSSFNLQSNWRIRRCSNINPTVDEKTIVLVAGGGSRWPTDMFCHALRRNLEVSGDYAISTTLKNEASTKGPAFGNIGFAFNVWDRSNYDFAYLRYVQSSGILTFILLLHE